MEIWFTGVWRLEWHPVCWHPPAKTFAYDLAVPIVFVADILGRASLSATQRYRHAKLDTLLDIGSRMQSARHKWGVRHAAWTSYVPKGFTIARTVGLFFVLR